MAKVGIMSMQRIINYGSFLQAFALKKIIESLEHEVEFIDYIYEKTIIENKKNTIINKIKRNINFVEYIKKKKNISEFQKKFKEEYFPILNIKELNHNKNIEYLIIGSDEVFNCLQPYPVGYSRNLFGKEYEKQTIISYAASFGFTTIEGLKKHNISEEIANMFKNFKSISVRDNNSYNIVKELTNEPNKLSINLDPVFIYDFSKYIKKVDISNYIIIYAYPGRLTKEEIKYIKSFAKKNNKKILSLGVYQKIADIVKIVNPTEIFSYFKYADYVITDTFHGSIFAMKTNTKFCTIIRDSNENKLVDLLERLKQSDRKVTNINEIEELYKQDIDFTKTNKIIANERKRTIEYLKNNLK